MAGRIARGGEVTALMEENRENINNVIYQYNAVCFWENY
jgi:hypothetical protein